MATDNSQPKKVVIIINGDQTEKPATPAANKAQGQSETEGETPRRRGDETVQFPDGRIGPNPSL
jgi:hypothetical protein